MSDILLTDLSVSDSGDALWYWSPISSDDQTGVGWVICMMAMSFVLVATLIRVSLKKWILGADDAAIAMALLFYLLQVATFFVSLDEGLGKDSSLLSNAQQLKAFYSAYASDVLAITTHYIAKMSMGILVYNLFKGNKAMLNTRICEGLLGLILLSGVLSVVVLLSASGAVAHVSMTGSISTTSRWDAIFAFDVITELALAGVPIYLILTILRQNSQRFVVCAVFMLRLPVIALGALHLARLSSLVESPSDVGPALLNCESVLQILLAWSIVSASVPALKSLAQPFDVIKGHNLAGYGYGNDRTANSRSTRAATGFFYGPGGKA